MTNHNPQHNYTLGIFLILLGAASMAAMGIFVKLLGPSFNWSETLFFRFGLSFIFFLPLILKDKTFTVKIKKPLWLAIRIFGGSSSMILYFVVLHYLSLANATLLVMSAPIYVPVFALCLLGVKTNWKVWAGIVLAVIGIALVLHPTAGIFKSIALVGVLSGVLQGLSNLAQRKVFLYQSANQVLFYFYVVTILFLLAVVPFYWKTPVGIQWLYILGVAGFGCIFTTCYTIAFKYAPSRYLSPFSLTSIIFAGVLDWVVWSTLPGMLSLIGASVLVLGLIIVLLGKK